MSSILAIPLIFGGLSTSSPVYQRAIAIGNFAGQMAGQAAAAREQACMMGAVSSAKDVQEAAKPATQLMRSYWGAVKSGQPANISALYHLDSFRGWSGAFQIDGDVVWGRGVTSATAQGLSAVVDPFARSQLLFDPDARIIVRANDGKSALGHWRLMTASGSWAGTYDALFERKQGVWKLVSLNLSGPGVFVAPPVQYCHKPGDVAPFRLAHYASERTRLAREAVEREVEAYEAETALAALLASGATGVTVTQAETKAERARRLAIQSRGAADSAARAAIAEQDRQARQSERAKSNRGQAGVAL